MRLETLTPKVSGPRLSVMERSRALVYAMMTGAALSVAACGGSPDDPNNNPDGGAGTGGSAGSGGIDGGAGAGGEAGNDPCENLEFEGLGSKVYDVNEDGSFSVTGLTGTDQAYNGLTFEVKDGAMFTKRTRIGLQKVIYDNYQTGYDSIGDVSGIRPYAIDENKHYVDDGQGIGNCVLNRVALNEAVLADPLKRPVMRTPEGYYTTVFQIKDNSESVNDYAFLPTRTEFTLDSLTSASGTSDYILGNSLPGGQDPALAIKPDGKLEINATQVTDEGKNTDQILLGLNPSASGLTFEPIPGQPGMYRSTQPFAGDTLNLSWSGLNEGLTNDTVTKLLNVESPPNNSPTINSLLANPNPCSSYDSTTLSFNVFDPDNDNVNWTLTMDDTLGVNDQLVNPSNGSCNGLTCSGTLPSGGGNVTILYNTGDYGNPAMNLNVDDSKGGTDQDQEVVQVLP